MFATGIAANRSADKRLYDSIRNTYIGIIEMEALEEIKSIGKEFALENGLRLIFPRAFVLREPEKAIQIIYDLDDIARSETVRETLPPQHVYAMYQMIRNYEEFIHENGISACDPELENYIRENYQDEEEAEALLGFFEFIAEDFVEQYDDNFIWLDIWEHMFLWDISQPEEMQFRDMDSQEMLALMPNDIIYQWKKQSQEKQKGDAKKQALTPAIQSFKTFVEGNAYSIFQTLKQPVEEIGRTLLQTYLRPRGFREAQMAGGRSDLIYPAEEAVIETKIWRDQERFKDGMTELVCYLESQNYTEGFYILFDNTQKDNIVVSQFGQDMFDIELQGKKIHVCFIKINPIAPSKRRRA